MSALHSAVVAVGEGGFRHTSWGVLFISAQSLQRLHFFLSWQPPQPGVRQPTTPSSPTVSPLPTLASFAHSKSRLTRIPAWISSPSGPVTSIRTRKQIQMRHLNVLSTDQVAPWARNSKLDGKPPAPLEGIGRRLAPEHANALGALPATSSVAHPYRLPDLAPRPESRAVAHGHPLTDW